ncbi:MAG: hypothetical protein ACM3PS_10520 [Syntrophothermus sp.]
MASRNPKNKPTKNEYRESSTTKWLRIFLIAFSIMLILSMILSLVR